jgi:hypothetical protein
MKLEVKNGWFVERFNDYYDDCNWYYGVFESEEEARQYSKKLYRECFEKRTGHYKMEIVFLPYVEYDGNYIPLCYHTFCEEIS